MHTPKCARSLHAHAKVCAVGNTVTGKIRFSRVWATCTLAACTLAACNMNEVTMVVYGTHLLWRVVVWS